MKLIVKFNLVFITVFLIGLGIAAHVADRLLQHNAREEMQHSARLIMEAALATRSYTSSQVGPLLQTQMKYGFLPQSVPALTAVTLFHFFFCWNDFFLPLVYLAGHKDLVPISVGLTGFKQLYSQQTNLIQAGSLIAAIFPLTVFFFAQRVFMQGIVITGVDK